MSLKNFKFTVEYTIQIDEITDESIKKGLSRFANYEELLDDPNFLEMGRKSKRLLDALLANPEVMEKFLPKVFVNLIEADGVRLVKEFIGADQPHTYNDEEDILQPLMKNLSEEDRKFFNDIRASGLYYENTEDFFDAFSLSLDKITKNEL